MDAVLQVNVVVVRCGCGFYPLDKAMHRTADGAWRAAAAHVALNPTLCHPTMVRDTVPAMLAPSS